MTRSTFPALLAFGAMTVSGCVVNVDSEGHAIRDERRFTTPGTPELRLTTFDGPIEVQAWEGDGVFVEIERRGATREEAESIEIVAEQDGNRVHVEARRERRDDRMIDIGFTVSPRARLIARVPPASHVTARSGDGSIRIHEVSGRLELRTDDGSVRGADLGGSVLVRTGDGSVALDTVRGRVEVETGDGSIGVSGALEGLRVRTSDGSIHLRLHEGSRMAEDWEVSTSDGGITVELPDGFAAAIDAHTGEGSVRAGDEVGLRTEVRDRRAVRGTLGSGGHTFRLRTGDGSIRLRGTP